MKTLVTAIRPLTLVSLITLVVTMTMSPLPAHAAKATTFIALLNSGQEVPVGTSSAAGIAYMTLGSDDRLCVSLSFGGLGSALAAAHVHGPAAPGVNADVLFPLPTTSPINTCVGPLDNDQRKDLRRGRFYLNVHSADLPGGEIRGQIEPIRK
jgi:hypothetical protein